MSSLPVLYSFRRCPYAMRARLALAVSQTEIELREVVLRSKPPALLHASAKATVPVLVLPRGEVLEESLQIMQWALERHDPQGWLGAAPASATALQAEEMLGLIAASDGPFKQALDYCKYPERADENQAVLAWQEAQAWLQTLERRLETHAALCGNRASLADAAIFPFVRQFAAIDPPRWEAMPLPQLRIWLGAWLEGSLFASIMQKYPAWSEASPPLRVFASRS